MLLACLTFGYPAAGSNATTSLSMTLEIYLGNGCFWERQWAYVQIEQQQFERADSAVTSLAGYAGGKTPTDGGDFVCYDGGPHDYTTLGHGEVTQVTVKDAAQVAALASDFFASFQGPDGARQRPDPFNMGPPYRSLIGLPGGATSPLYTVFEDANVHKMELRPSTGGSDDDEINVVWVYDSTAFPFWPAEVYHQLHCNSFMNEGMPYAASCAFCPNARPPARPPPLRLASRACARSLTRLLPPAQTGTTCGTRCRTVAESSRCAPAPPQHPAPPARPPHPPSARVC